MLTFVRSQELLSGFFHRASIGTKYGEFYAVRLNFSDVCVFYAVRLIFCVMPQYFAVRRSFQMPPFLLHYIHSPPAAASICQQKKKCSLCPVRSHSFFLNHFTLLPSVIYAQTVNCARLRPSENTRRYTLEHLLIFANCFSAAAVSQYTFHRPQLLQSLPPCVMKPLTSSTG